MIPPRGFQQERYPLRHKLIYSFGLSAKTSTMNTAIAPLIMGSSDMDIEPEAVIVNPHNTAYMEDVGPLCRQMSIIDKLSLTIRFNMTSYCNPKNEIAAGTFNGDGITHLKLLWRPIFFSFPEKLTAADDVTTTTVAAILGLTSDDTNQDVVALTTNKLPVIGESDKLHPVSLINAVQVITDYNMTTNFGMEDHVWDENLFQDAIRRYTNKGALKACVGRTRHVNLTTNQPYKTFHINKFVPRSIRRVVDRTYMAIQVHLPLDSDISQDYMGKSLSASVAHVGCKIICRYHEWSHEHDQDMSSQV